MLKHKTKYPPSSECYPQGGGFRHTPDCKSLEKFSKKTVYPPSSECYPQGGGFRHTPDCKKK